jgi:hypothetical protein
MPQSASFKPVRPIVETTPYYDYLKVLRGGGEGEGIFFEKSPPPQAL